MALIGLVLAIVVFIYAIVYVYKYYRYLHENIDKIQGPAQFPILGNFHQLKPNSDRKSGNCLKANFCNFRPFLTRAKNREIFFFFKKSQKCPKILKNHKN